MDKIKKSDQLSIFSPLSNSAVGRQALPDYIFGESTSCHKQTPEEQVLRNQVYKEQLLIQQLFAEKHLKGKLLIDLFQAYYDARKNKRNTVNALAFEIEYEHKLFELYQDIITGNYQISPSICFIVFRPVKREIFAATFRDRIIHHLIHNYVNEMFDNRFIYDSYSCRKGKGTACGIKRVDHFIRACSKNYQAGAYILKVDIKGYFMSIDRALLYEQVKTILERGKNKVDFDFDLILSLINKIIFNDPVKNCIVKGTKEDWQGLPKSKSLFYVGKNKGLPIGNLTSQLFANVYLNELDHFIKGTLKIKYYGRYVDDMVMVHEDKEHLKYVIYRTKKYLQDQLGLALHPKKIYLQYFTKGVSFLGVIIKPWYIYIKKRTKANFYRCISFWNVFIIKGKVDLDKFLASINSYLGIMQHYTTYNLRKRMLNKLLVYWYDSVGVGEGYTKLIPTQF